jgi:poly-gamma-glutamate capsule biosynthesis protein CapA/YwtB (metallophosphatase superfamily)
MTAPIHALISLTLLLVLVAVPPAHAQKKGATSLSWVGDMAISKRHGLPPNGGKGLFPRRVKRFFAATDVVTGNLEGTLGSGGPPKCKTAERHREGQVRSAGNCFSFQAPARYARLYARVGFDLVNLANNHALDYGTPGLRQTIAALRRSRIAFTGLRGRIKVKRVGGRRIAFVGFAPYAWAWPLLDIGVAKRVVRRASRKADAVVVMMHAGAEGAGATHTPRGTEHAFGENRGNPRRFGHAVVRAGADAVLGSGPHVLRGIECYGGRVIAYSLGNFVGYRTLSTNGVAALSGILRVRLGKRGRFAGGRLFPVRLVSPGKPRRDASRASIRLVRRLSRSDFGRRACRIGRGGAIRPAGDAGAPSN